MGGGPKDALTWGATALAWPFTALSGKPAALLADGESPSAGLEAESKAALPDKSVYPASTLCAFWGGAAAKPRDTGGFENPATSDPDAPVSEMRGGTVIAGADPVDTGGGIASETMTGFTAACDGAVPLEAVFGFAFLALLSERALWADSSGRAFSASFVALMAAICGSSPIAIFAASAPASARA
jgi:hypothetical protein